MCNRYYSKHYSHQFIPNILQRYQCKKKQQRLYAEHPTLTTTIIKTTSSITSECSAFCVKTCSEWKNRYIRSRSRKKPSCSRILVHKLVKKTEQKIIYVVQLDVASSCIRICCSKLFRSISAVTIIARMKKKH